MPQGLVAVAAAASAAPASTSTRGNIVTSWGAKKAAEGAVGTSARTTAVAAATTEAAPKAGADAAKKPVSRKRIHADAAATGTQCALLDESRNASLIFACTDCMPRLPVPAPSSWCPCSFVALLSFVCISTESVHLSPADAGPSTVTAHSGAAQPPAKARRTAAAQTAAGPAARRAAEAEASASGRQAVTQPSNRHVCASRYVAAAAVVLKLQASRPRRILAYSIVVW